MIFGNINNLNEYDFLNLKILACFEYAKQHNLIEYEKGTHEIQGQNLFVNIVEYETTDKENRFWEAHRQYLDLHLMLEGEEQIDLNFVGNMTQMEYEKDKDFLPLKGEPNSHAVLRKGDFLICYPKDGHMTAIAAEKPSQVKKAIFKIIIQ